MSQWSSWLPGNGVKQEQEGYYINKIYKSYETLFFSTGENWFHFPIPTPVIVDDKRVGLSRIYVLYKTSSGAKIMQIEARDGGKPPCRKWTNLNLDGDHSQPVVDPFNHWDVNPIEAMFTGLTISIKVNFGDSTPQGLPGIAFIAAGADFQTL